MTAAVEESSLPRCLAVEEETQVEVAAAVRIIRRQRPPVQSCNFFIPRSTATPTITTAVAA